MKKIMFIMIFLILSLSMSLNFVAADSYEQSFEVNFNTDTSGLQVDFLKYEPYPVNPGEYFNLWISVKKTGNGAKSATFELIPSYPFSLDTNENAIKKYSSLSGESALLEYQIRVADDAVEGPNKIKLKLQLEGQSGFISQEFEIYVSSAQTNFDGVIQGIEGGSITFALANTGKNVANSVIVKIPKQDYFEAIGTSGQMVGNLDDGDYTIVGFDIKQLIQENESSIIFQIDYTDNIGERRTNYLELPLNLFSKTSIGDGEIPSGIPKNRSPAPTNSNNTWIWGVAGILILTLLIYRKKIKNLIQHKKNLK